MNELSHYKASSCIHRNLSTSQRALIAAGFLAYEQEAKKRQTAALKQGDKLLVGANLPEGSDLGRAREKAGERMHVGGRTVDDAAKVLARRKEA